MYIFFVKIFYCYSVIFFNKMNSFKSIQDGKVTLVNENNIRPATINHLKNKNFFQNINYNENEGITNNTFPFQKINPIINEEEERINILKSIDNMTFKNKSDEYNNEITSYNKNDIMKELENKNNELKKMTELFDQLSEEYSKLNAKHNALMVYASDLQKKLDLYSIQKTNNNKSQMEIDDMTNRILQEKDNMISVLQNQVNYYKEICNSINKNIFGMNNINDDIQNQINNLSKYYIKENKRLKNQLKKYSAIDFEVFEKEINIQIDNFNQILNNYHNRLNDALSQIPEFFNRDQKEEAAKYLISQVNNFMSENQKLFSDNFRLNTQVKELEAQLNSNNNNISFSEEENNDLENRIEELESLVKTLSKNQSNLNNNQNNNFQLNNNEIQIRECLNNTMNEIKEKDKIIADLKNQLIETSNKHNLNFDERKIVNSMSKKLYEKDIIIQDLKNQLNSGSNKVDEIRRNKEEFISKIQ